MVVQKYHLLKEQLSTLSSLSGYVLNILEKQGCETLFNTDGTTSACCTHEESLENVVVEDCTDLGTLMIKGLIRIQKKLKQKRTHCTVSGAVGSVDSHYRGTFSGQPSSKHVDHDDVSSEKEVTTTGIFDSLAQSTVSDMDFGKEKAAAIEIKSEGEDGYEDEPQHHFQITGVSSLQSLHDHLRNRIEPEDVSQGDVMSETSSFNLGDSHQEISEADDNSGTHVQKEKKGNNKEGKEPKRYECSFCGKVLASYKNFIRHRKVHKDFGKYTCKDCWKAFTTEGSLKKHNCLYRPKDPASTLSCSVCKKEFTKESDLEGHMLIHGGRQPYDCSVCGKKFVSLFEYEMHARTHGGEKELHCETCDKVFASRKSLQRHRYLHSSQKAYSCQWCSKEFVTSFDLKKHALTHAAQTEFVCDVCKKSYSNEESLRRHRLLHKQSSSKVHTCDKCDNSFALLSDLEEHLRMVHAAPSEGANEGQQGVTGSGRRTCKICGKHYSSQRNLVRHKLLHNRSSQNPCPFCTKKFINSYHLQQHLLTHRKQAQDEKEASSKAEKEASSKTDPEADEKSSRTCGMCNKVFKARKYLKRHEALHREKPFCRECRRFFLTPELYEVHKVKDVCGRAPVMEEAQDENEGSKDDTKSPTCWICNKEFTSTKNMKKHLVLHKEKPFCTLCKRFFLSAEILEKHMESHTSGENLSCDICDKAFSSKSNLRLHRRLHLRHKLHICSICSKGFATPSAFRKHARTHTVETPPRGSGSHTKSKASTGQSSTHPQGDDDAHKINRNECTKCGRTFMSSFHLRIHMSTHSHKLNSHKLTVGSSQGSATTYSVQDDPNNSAAVDPLGGNDTGVAEATAVEPPRCGECFEFFEDVEHLRTHIMESSCSSFNCHLCGAHVESQEEKDVHLCGRRSMVLDEELGQPDALTSDISKLSHSSMLYVDESDATYSQDGSVNFTVESGMSELTADFDEISELDDDIHQCKNCRSTFETRQSLEAHKGECTLSGCFECDVCGKQFDNSHGLMLHSYRHLDNAAKPWKCDICQKGFITKSHVKRHKLIHSGEKRHVCDICGKGFIRSDMLGTHMKKAH